MSVVVRAEIDSRTMFCRARLAGARGMGYDVLAVVLTGPDESVSAASRLPADLGVGHRCLAKAQPVAVTRNRRPVSDGGFWMFLFEALVWVISLYGR